MHALNVPVANRRRDISKKKIRYTSNLIMSSHRISRHHERNIVRFVKHFANLLKTNRFIRHANHVLCSAELPNCFSTFRTSTLQTVGRRVFFVNGLSVIYMIEKRILKLEKPFFFRWISNVCWLQRKRMNMEILLLKSDANKC